MADGTRLLVVGDMHLGRTPTRLPDSLLEYDLKPHQLGPAAAWRAVRRFACSQDIDAVVLAGDLVESVNARFEAYGYLKESVDQLVNAGVAVYAVAGNHDVVALPKLASELDGFCLMGAGGKWREYAVPQEGQPAVRLLGWSFFRAETTGSPLADGLPPRVDHVPRLGILHCDLDAGGSRYAPVTGAELAAADVDAWLLGHVHKPTLSSSHQPGATPTPAPGYLGSLVGLDPTETGRHGPWLVTIGPGGKIELDQVPLAPLRWERLTVELDTTVEPDNLFERVVARVKERYQELAGELDETLALGCRIRLTGRTTDYHGLERVLRRETLVGMVIPCGSVKVFIERVLNDTVPAYDLDAIARGEDPPGLLARLLVALGEQGDDELLAAARSELDKVARQKEFIDLDLPPPTDEQLGQQLIRAGQRALDELLAQREVTDASA